MGQQKTKKWVVLLNKVPRGPLAEHEVIALLDEGHLRPNDMAYEVPPDAVAGIEKQTAQWKLLWQFPEFAGHSKESTLEEPDKAVPAVPVSEIPSVEAEAQDPAEAEASSQEVLDIQPEELVLHGRPDSELGEMENLPVSNTKIDTRWLGGAVVIGVLCLFLGLGYFFSQSESPKSRRGLTQIKPGRAGKAKKFNRRKDRPVKPRVRRGPAPRELTPPPAIRTTTPSRQIEKQEEKKTAAAAPKKRNRRRQPVDLDPPEDELSAADEGEILDRRGLERELSQEQNEFIDEELPRLREREGFSEEGEPFEEGFDEGFQPPPQGGGFEEEYYDD